MWFHAPSPDAPFRLWHQLPAVNITQVRLTVQQAQAQRQSVTLTVINPPHREWQTVLIWPHLTPQWCLVQVHPHQTSEHPPVQQV